MLMDILNKNSSPCFSSSYDPRTILYDACHCNNIFAFSRFSHIDNQFIKDRCLVLLNLNIILRSYKSSIQAIISHHGFFMCCGHYTIFVNYCITLYWGWKTIYSMIPAFLFCPIRYRSRHRHHNLRVGKYVFPRWPLIWLGYWTRIVLLHVIII